MKNLLILLIISLVVSACGKRGPLVPPPAPEGHPHPHHYPNR